MPSTSLLEHWSAATPADFIFALKCNRRITHELRLHEAESAVERSPKGPCPWKQVGPGAVPVAALVHKDLERLDAFLAVLAQVGQGIRPAFEFRHASWFSDDVYASLRAAGAALCIAEAEKLETPLQATTSWATCACAAKTTRPRRSTPGPVASLSSPGAKPTSSSNTRRQRRLAWLAGCSMPSRFLNRPWRSESADRRSCRRKTRRPLARGPGAG